MLTVTMLTDFSKKKKVYLMVLLEEMSVCILMPVEKFMAVDPVDVEIFISLLK